MNRSLTARLTACRHTLSIMVLIINVTLPTAWVTAAGPPPSLNAPILADVEEFAMSHSQTERLSLAYCKQGCGTIFYRTLSETGAWSEDEVVKADWNQRMGDFAIDIDQAGIPHVFWGEGVDTSGTIHHATRQANGSWSDVIVASGSYGRLNAVRIGSDDQIRLLTTSDFRVGGGYLFSDLAYIYGPSQGPLTTEIIVIADESLHDIDIALDSTNTPMFAVGQSQYGGWLASKLIYQEATQWHERVLSNAWGSCEWPVRIAVGAAIHINKCSSYTKLNDPQDTLTWVSSWEDDLAIDESDLPYFIDTNGSRVTIGGRARDGSSASLVIEDCEVSPCLEYTGGHILYDQDRGEVLPAYLDSDQGLHVKGYPKTLFDTYMGPDIAGSWQSLSQKCKTKSNQTRCKIKGTLLIRNQGPQEAGPSLIRFYLSTDPVIDTSDRQLAEGTLGNLKRQRTKKSKLQVTLADGQSAVGLFVIAVLDAGHSVLEMDEGNNLVVFGPMQ